MDTPPLPERDPRLDPAEFVPPGLPWGIVAFLAGFGGYYLLALVVTGTVSTISVNLDSIPAHERGPLALLALVPNLMLGIAPAALSRTRGRGLRRDFGLYFTRADLSLGFSCGVVALLVGLVVDLLLQHLVFHDTNATSVVQQLQQLSGGHSGWLVGVVVFLVIGAPLTEEILVRGALWGGLEYHRVPRQVILPLTALIFAFLHQEPTLTLALFGQGLAIGYARMSSGRIGASIVAHATNNLVPALVLWFAS